MTHIATKESLNALANLAFRAIQYEDSNAPPEQNLNEGPDEAIYQLLRKEGQDDGEREIDPELDGFYQGVSSGTLFGLNIAATIITHGLDSVAVREAVKAELDRNDYWWPEKSEAA